MRAGAPARVFVVDDDPAICDLLATFLTSRGYEPVPMTSAEQAVERFAVDRPSAVILDVVLPGGMDGIAALAAFRKIDRDVPVIVISGQGRTATVVQAMKLGAIDFVSKPFSDADLDTPLANAMRQHEVSCEIAELREQLRGESRTPMIIGQSPRMCEVRDLIARVADADVTVLVRGESGTGKEVVARALHATSNRRDKPMVKVNCAALPVELLESELFGFERGAFTGAFQHKPGKFEFANQGTMFLDEISEMSPALQAKLLQVLQDGEFSRLGGKADVRVDVRVIAATNRDLEQAVAEGQFREDLFFRLNVVSITLPPLRERRDEIRPLTEYFLKKYSVQYNKPLIELSSDTTQALVDYDWPGNVRELENLARRAVVLGSETPIRRELQQAATLYRHRLDLKASPAAHASPRPAVAVAAPPIAPPIEEPVVPVQPLPVDVLPGQCSLKDISRHAAREAERELILRMLQHTRWNRKEAAEHLGISYKALLYKIKENGLDRAS